MDRSAAPERALEAGNRLHKLRFDPDEGEAFRFPAMLSDFDLGFYRVGDVALFVGEVVEVFEFGGIGAHFASEGDARIQGDVAYPWHAAVVFGHYAHSSIVVFVDLKALAVSNEQKGEHVAA